MTLEAPTNAQGSSSPLEPRWESIISETRADEITPPDSVSGACEMFLYFQESRVSRNRHSPKKVSTSAPGRLFSQSHVRDSKLLFLATTPHCMSPVVLPASSGLLLVS
ncbi:hypothetical protein MN608_00366 [Microdochium nivale]|nr:hypothetical protein MN608_00366 [Microdochium nivale]